MQHFPNKLPGDAAAADSGHTELKRDVLMTVTCLQSRQFPTFSEIPIFDSEYLRQLYEHSFFSPQRKTTIMFVFLFLCH